MEEIKIGEKTYTVKQISYIDALEVEELRNKSIKEAVKKLIEIATDIPAEEIQKLSLKEGLEVQKLINKVNEFGDFQQSGQSDVVS